MIKLPRGFASVERPAPTNVQNNFYENTFYFPYLRANNLILEPIISYSKANYFFPNVLASSSFFRSEPRYGTATHCYILGQFSIRHEVDLRLPFFFLSAAFFISYLSFISSVICNYFYLLFKGLF